MTSHEAFIEFKNRSGCIGSCAEEAWDAAVEWTKAEAAKACLSQDGVHDAIYADSIMEMK